MSKKISLLSSSLAGGGSENVCVNIANNLAQKGWQIDLLVLNLKNEVYKKFLSNKINLVVLDKNNARYSILPLIKYIYTNKPKIFLIFNYEFTIILNLLRFFLRLDIKIISRNSNTLSRKFKQFEKQSFWRRNIVLKLIKSFYHKSDHVINQCNAMRNDLINLYPQLYDTSSVIYNPIPSNIDDFIKKNHITKLKKENYILCVGRLVDQKAFHYVIEAFAGLRTSIPNLRLKIVGEGNLEHELKKKSIDLNINNYVDFEGFQKNIIPYYLYSKATILSSIYEGYPNVLIESIALNTPVVAFNCPSGPNEIVQDGINGYLVNYLDVEDLKNKILATLSDNFKYENLKNSLSKNNIEKVCESYERLIHSLS